MLKACPLLGGVHGCFAPPKFPNLQKKSSKLLFVSKGSLKNWEFYVFLDKEMAQNSGKGPLVRFAPFEVKKTPEFFAKCPHSENQEEIHFWKICTLLRWKSMVWAWLKPVKCIGLGSWAPSIFWVGVGVSFSPPPKKRRSYILKDLD